MQEEGLAFLFESVVGGERLGRYSASSAPGRFCVSKLQRSDCHDRQSRRQRPRLQEHPDPLRLLEETLATYRAPHVPGLPRFCGGAVGYAGYDTVRYAERLPNPPADDRDLPDLCFAFTTAWSSSITSTRRWPVVAPCRTSDQKSPKTNCDGSYDDALPARGSAGRTAAAGRRRFAAHRYRARRSAKCAAVIARTSRRRHSKPAVEKRKEYIHAGDIFQVVISQRLQTETRARPFDIYRTLRVVNPSPFMFYLSAGPLRLVGSSPEIMVRVEGDQVTDPAAGRHAPARRDGGRRRPAGRGTARRPEGTGRAHHARRPGPQRCRPGGPVWHAFNCATC